MQLKQWIYDAFSLFFPQTCKACDQLLVTGEKLICTSCWYHLPYTEAHLDPGNRIARQLWGLVNVAGATAYLYFLDDSRVKHMVYQFKYGNSPDIGRILGERYGATLSTVAPFSDAMLIIPVPLHPKKQRRRGYNQSAYFARGLGHAMRKPVLENGLIRLKDTASQTQKDRWERYENMQEIFAVYDPDAVIGKQVLLVDDVLTTGATVAACAQALLAAGAEQVSIVSLAKAV